MRSRTLISIVGIISISLVFAWISTGFQTFQGWVSFLAVTILGAGILLAGWRALSRDPKFRFAETSNPPSASQLPPWLTWLLIAASILRLGAGVLWFTALPNLGYGGEVEVAGYVMSDAHKRDTAAWKLAQSEKSLFAAFSEYRGADQYGGMLFGSALVYRYLGGEVHHPLQMVVLTAAFSALAVLFVWAFTHRLWDEKIATVAAWIVAIFPDAILLGSSQMREALMMTLVIMAFYGLVRTRQDRSKSGVAWLVVPLVISLPLSPLFTLMLAGMLGVYTLFLSAIPKGVFGAGIQWLKDWRIWVIFIGLVALGLLIVTFLGEQFLPGGASNPVAFLQLWLRQAARWQAFNSEHASGWMQKIFRSTPEWSHTWLLLIYGMARPFLPAALFDPGASIWQGIAIWRSLGWALLLPFLIVAPFIAGYKERWRSPVMGLSLLVWAGVIIASFRGGGDAWDNPRYRVTWIGIQAALAAWVWLTQKRDDSPWLRRVLIALGLIFLWFMPWYLDRMTPFEWLVKDVFLTLGLGMLSALIYVGADMWIAHRRTTKS